MKIFTFKITYSIEPLSTERVPIEAETAAEAWAIIWRKRQYKFKKIELLYEPTSKE